MDIKTVTYTRKFNIGNYESMECGFEAGLSEIEGGNVEKVLEVFARLEDVAEAYLQYRVRAPEKQPIDRVKKDTSGVKIVPKPEPFRFKEVPIPQPKSKLKLYLPDTLLKLVTISEKAGVYIVKQVRRLDKSDWILITNAVKAVGGEWISAKANSHWSVPKK